MKWCCDFCNALFETQEKTLDHIADIHMDEVEEFIASHACEVAEEESELEEARRTR